MVYDESRKSGNKETQRRATPAVVCPHCQMPRDQWPNPEGYQKDENVLYCCEGCGEGSGCTCNDSENPSTEDTTLPDRNESI